TVDAHDAPAFAAADHEVEAVIDRAASIGLVHALEAHHVLTRTRRRSEIEGDGLATAWRLHAIDLLQFLHAALDLRCMGSTRLEALDELDFLGKHRLLTLELGLLLLFVQRPLPLIESIVA